MLNMRSVRPRRNAKCTQFASQRDDWSPGLIQLLPAGCLHESDPGGSTTRVRVADIATTASFRSSRRRSAIHVRRDKASYSQHAVILLSKVFIKFSSITFVW